MSEQAKYIICTDALADWRDAIYSGVAPTLYPVGTGALERIEIGPGRVVLIGGLPGGGKTALTTQLIIDALRAEPKLRALVANVEMTPSVLLDRQLARLSGVPLDLIARRQLDNSHADQIDRGIGTLEAIAERLVFVESPYTLENIVSAADEFNANLLVLDYLQRIKPPGAHADKRGGVDALMDYLRQFADAGRALLCVSALSRSKDSRGRSSYDGNSLNLASFRESSELEYGCDTAYVLVPDSKDDELVVLRCLKHRHGEPIDIPLRFEKRLQRFVSTGSAPTESEQAATQAKLDRLWASTPAATDDDGGADA